MGLLLSMAGIDSTAASAFTGLVLAAFGAFVQSLPYMNRREAQPPLSGRRGRPVLPGTETESSKENHTSQKQWRQASRGFRKGI